VILLTGATGTIGSALLRRLVADGTAVRCLVRDPKRLGPERVRVQIALGNLADPSSFRNALRGVDTVIHLAASIRDQPRGSIEELNALATLRLVRAAERAGVQRFYFMSALGASLQSRTRFFRSKALARKAVESSSLETTVFSPSIAYTPGDPWLTILDRLSHLPVLPIAGRGDTQFQPIWAEDVADCIEATLGMSHGRSESRHHSFDLAGPELLSYEQLTRIALAAWQRDRPLVNLPMPVVKASLKAVEYLVGPSVFATPEEVGLMEERMVSPRGTTDAESLGVTPLRVPAVLG
jgi:uncharacterized protein YbjT (DUF2867 family)